MDLELQMVSRSLAQRQYIIWRIRWMTQPQPYLTLLFLLECLDT